MAGPDTFFPAVQELRQRRTESLLGSISSGASILLAGARNKREQDEFDFEKKTRLDPETVKAAKKGALEDLQYTRDSRVPAEEAKEAIRAELTAKKNVYADADRERRIRPTEASEKAYQAAKRDLELAESTSKKEALAALSGKTIPIDFDGASPTPPTQVPLSAVGILGPTIETAMKIRLLENGSLGKLLLQSTFNPSGAAPDQLGAFTIPAGDAAAMDKLGLNSGRPVVTKPAAPPARYPRGY